MGALSRAELQRMGFAALGQDVFLSDRASIHGASRIALGDHVRIDDFCVLSAGEGGITIGRNVHIAVYSSVIGAGRITLGDFSGLSSRVAIYSSNDDYSGRTMTNPTVAREYTGVTDCDVSVGSHVIIGAGSVILPGVTLGEGVAIGALSVVGVDCAPFTIHSGTPARLRGARSRELLEVEKRLRAAESVQALTDARRQ